MRKNSVFSISQPREHLYLSQRTFPQSRPEGEPISTCGTFRHHQAGILGIIKLESLQEMSGKKEPPVEVTIKSRFDLGMYVCMLLSCS